MGIPKLTSPVIQIGPFRTKRTIYLNRVFINYSNIYLEYLLISFVLNHIGQRAHSCIKFFGFQCVFHFANRCLVPFHLENVPLKSYLDKQ